MNKKLVRSVIIFFSLLCFYNSSLRGEQKPLKIGDKVPDIEFKIISRQDNTVRKVKLFDYKGVPVILDFWASWCGSCLGRFPQMEQLGKKFAGKLQILPVNAVITGDKMAKVQEMLSEGKIRGTDIAADFKTAIEDTIATRLFPCAALPQYVWINQRGVVVAITNSDYVNEKNIQQMIDGEVIDLPLKKDFFHNKVSMEEITVDDDLFRFSLFKKGKVNSLENYGRAIKDGYEQYFFSTGEQERRGIIMRNIPLVEMYKTVITRSGIPGVSSSGWYKSRIVLEVKDTSKLAYEYDDYWGTYSCKDENLYNYELVLPLQEVDSANTYMLQDLNKYSGYYGRREKRRVNCLVVETIKGFIKPKPGDSLYHIGCGPHIQRGDTITVTGSDPFCLVNDLNRYSVFNIPVLDESLANISLSYTIDLKNPDVDQLNKELKKYGLILKKEKRELDMLIISDR